LVDVINNNPEAGWSADSNSEYFGRFQDDFGRVKRLMGVKSDQNRLPELDPVERGIPSNIGAVPVSFDSREQWPGCIGAIRNQGDCGSCWAFGGVEALSDRFCVASKGQTHVTLAPLDPTTCAREDSGCEGGDLSSLWEYSKESGIVEEACTPYNDSIPTCPPAQQPCLNFVPTPPCKKQCTNDAFNGTWTSSKHFSQSIYAVAAKVADIQTEIMTNGPVEAAFSVYQDFLSYKSGVYKHLTGEYVCGHAIKIIGWGVANNTDYWTVANSWTDTWGMDGYFLILRGVNECGIEGNVYAGLPKL